MGGGVLEGGGLGLQEVLVVGKWKKKKGYRSVFIRVAFSSLQEESAGRRRGGRGGRLVLRRLRWERRWVKWRWGGGGSSPAWFSIGGCGAGAANAAGGAGAAGEAAAAETGHAAAASGSAVDSLDSSPTGPASDGTNGGFLQRPPPSSVYHAQSHTTPDMLNVLASHTQCLNRVFITSGPHSASLLAGWRRVTAVTMFWANDKVRHFSYLAQ